MQMNGTLSFFIFLYWFIQVKSDVPEEGRERTWIRMASYVNKLEQSGQIWTKDAVSRLRCTVICTTDPECESVFYSQVLTRCVALSKQPEEFISLLDQQGYNFYHSRPEVCKTSYSYRDSVKLCYKIVFNGQTHMDAKTMCANDGGHLLRIDSEVKQNFVRETLQELNPTSGTHFYIEATDDQTEGEFRWGDGSLLIYTSWYPLEPNNENGIEDCVILANANYSWYDVPCDNQKAYICEIDT